MTLNVFSRWLSCAILLCAAATIGAKDLDLPTSFDLRNVNGENYVTSVKSQQGGTCWTHGAMAAIEGNLLMTGTWAAAGETGEPNMAEYHLDWWNGFNSYCNDDDPSGGGLTVHNGGDYRVTSAYLSRGEGAVRDVDAQSFGTAPDRYSPDYHYYYVRDIEWYNAGADLSNIDVIKSHLMTDGVIGTCLLAGTGYTVNAIHYQPPSSTKDPNHAVAIVGWDDNKVTQAPLPGAWLCKNSWGAGWGLNGFFWISYYDKHAGHNPEMGAVSFQDVIPNPYDYYYYHDYHGWRDTKTDTTEAFNAFTVQGQGERLAGLGIYTAVDDVDYTAIVYDRFEGGQLLDPLTTLTGTIAYTGYHTLDISDKIMLQAGDDFYVYVSLSDGGHAYDRTSDVPVLLGGEGRTIVVSNSSPGQSYYREGGVWKDMYDYDNSANFCIKALSFIEPTLNFTFPEGLPEGHYPIGLETVVRTKIDPGTENYQQGTAMLNYRFLPNQNFTGIPMTPIGGDVFEAVIPPTQALFKPEYYIQAQGDQGNIINSPKKAPNVTYSFEAFMVEPMMSDDFEQDQGWYVDEMNVSDGGWERGDPGYTGPQPEDDHSPDGTLCYVTGKDGGNQSADDLDGGPSFLCSPTLQLKGGDAYIHLWVWFYHSSTGVQQPLEISVSNNDLLLNTVKVLPNSPQWIPISFRVSDYCTPTNLTRVWIMACDYPNDSIVEALVDDFTVEYINDHPSLWADRYQVPLSTGADVRFTLSAGQENAGRTYLLLGSLSGIDPGFALPGGKILPLNWDIVTDLLLSFTGTPICQDFLGKLAANGRAFPRMDLTSIVPLDPALIDKTLHFAFLLDGKPEWNFTSNAIPVTFEP